ncbi:MAG: phosphoenolpyruvate carboxylase [Myxococcota bacterium]|nr:phosphoenolpyruvate carboxylase [Myxococcota bacterium]
MENELLADVELLTGILDETIQDRSGKDALAVVRRLRETARALRGQGEGANARQQFADQLATLPVERLAFLARTFTAHFLLINAAEEQHRIRVLRQRDNPSSPPAGSIAAAVQALRESGVSAAELQGLLDQGLVMPVLTAHPSEARRATVLDHLQDLAVALDQLDDPRVQGRARERLIEALRSSVLALEVTDEARAHRPTPLDEVSAGLHVFERTLMDAIPRIYRALEDALERYYPGQSFQVPSFLRFGTWIGGDRDGNPNVTAEITRAAFSRQRATAIGRLVRDVEALGRELSVSAARAGEVPPALAEAIEAERERLPEVAARVHRKRGVEPWREYLAFIRARLQGALTREESAYASATEYLTDLRLLDRTLREAGLSRLAAGTLRDAIRRTEVFGFHLASVDIRQHSAVHEAAVAELLLPAGIDYRSLDEEERVRQLTGLLGRPDVGIRPDRTAVSDQTRELLASLEVVGRARRDLGPRACERWVISFAQSASDLLEVLLLARVARLAPDELRPVPLFEQLEDLEAAGPRVEAMLANDAIRAALQGELEVMVGYSDSGKQAGYVASTVALREAQEALAKVADQAGVTLTVFHGRGGAVGRGGGPSIRAIRAQPREALRGRFRVTEQGETIATRYGRPEIAIRDLAQMVHGVLLRSLIPDPPLAPEDRRRRDGALHAGAEAARRSYQELVGDRERLTAYVTRATPILEITRLRIASRPASRKGGLSFEDLRAIPWVFSWNQSRHGVPGWFGLGTALKAVAASIGPQGARQLYDGWPFFRAMVDNAQLALVRSDIDVASHYAQLADEGARGLFALIREEYRLTLEQILELTGERDLLAAWPTIARTVERRNPFVDVLSHVQIELMRRLRPDGDTAEQERLHRALAITINGIAAGLQTAG